MFNPFKCNPLPTYTNVGGYKKFLYCEPCKRGNNKSNDCCGSCGSVSLSEVIGRYITEMQVAYRMMPARPLSQKFEVKSVIKAQKTDIQTGLDAIKLVKDIYQMMGKHDGSGTFVNDSLFKLYPRIEHIGSGRCYESTPEPTFGTTIRKQ